MQFETHDTLRRAQPRPHTHLAGFAAPRDPAPLHAHDRPDHDHPGLSQAELRRIVIDLIG